MTTQYQDIGLTSPVTFLGATVLSFNGNLGFGAQESSLTIELIEDCENNQSFTVDSGAPYVFPTSSGGMSFSFAGIVTNWSTNEGSGGKTHSVTLTDPRRLLENTALIIDTYSGNINSPNVFNVYGLYDIYNSGGGNPDCTQFGASGVINDRGMPYQKIIDALQNHQVTIYTPKNFNGISYSFTVDFSNIPSGLPQYYRANGPSISILQFITDICEAIGYDFYVYLAPGIGGTPSVIKFGFIDLRQNPSSFNWIISNLQGNVTDRSYGRELRLEKQKTIIFGEKIHYMTMATNFVPYFGEDTNCQPIIGEAAGGCGFSFNISTRPLAASLRDPGGFGGNLNITEMDLRTAMGSYELWSDRILIGDSTVNGPGSFNAVAKAWFNANGIQSNFSKAFFDAANGIKQSSKDALVTDMVHDGGAAVSKLTLDRINEDARKIHGFIESLARTYYGKQYLAKLNELICYRVTGDTEGGANCITSEMVYSSNPTNDGGWIEPGNSFMGVPDPLLGFFRQEDGRVGPFVLFSVLGDPPSQPSTAPSGNYSSGNSSPNNPGYVPGGGWGG
ncbi:hypothetical protein EBZ38_11675 [bacterium]|nr:hypothetical protein [bacterium]NDD84912.1 hypothetical protein [bacterium]